VKSLERHHPEALFVSARTGRGVDALRAAILARLESHVVHVELAIDADAAKVLSFCYREGRVTHQDQDDAGRPRLQVRFSDAAAQRLLQTHGDAVEVLSRRGGRPNGAKGNGVQARDRERPPSQDRERPPSQDPERSPSQDRER
jgi:hypothetical protein